MSEIVKPTFASAGTSNTLAGLITRISNYIKLLGKEAAYLELQALDGEVAKSVNENSTLEDLTNAFLQIEAKEVKVNNNAIDLGTSDNKVIHDDVIKIEKGYYAEDTTFKVESLAESSAVTNAPDIQNDSYSDDIVENKEVWVNGKKITGTLTDYSTAANKNITPESTNAASATQDQEITLTIAEGKYNTSNVIKTGIIANVPAGPYKPEIVKTTDSETGETKTEAEGITIPAGYYHEAIKVIPVFKDIEGNVEDVINTTTLPVSKSGTYSPATDGYDYFTEVTVAKAELAGSVSSEKFDIANATATVAVTKAGWTDETSYQVTLPTKAAPSSVDSTAVTEGANVTITPAVSNAQSVTIPAGLYTSDVVVSVKSMANGEAVNASNISVNGAPSKVEVDGVDKYQVTVAVNKSGYIESGNYVASNLDASAIELDKNYISNDVVTNKTFNVSTVEGYTTGESKDLTVQDATTVVIASAKKLTVSTAADKGGKAGWYTGQEIDITDAVVKATQNIVETVDYPLVLSVENGTIEHETGRFYGSVDLSGLVNVMAAL